jgi:hypothetical protein
MDHVVPNFLFHQLLAAHLEFNILRDVMPDLPALYLRFLASAHHTFDENDLNAAFDANT